MSTSDDHSSVSHYLCRNCHTANTNRQVCSQCGSTIFEVVHRNTTNDSIQTPAPPPPPQQQQQLPNDYDNQQMLLVRAFENLFSSSDDLQSLTNMLLIMSQAPARLFEQQHRRRGRSPRRITRIKRSLPRYRYTPFPDILPFQVNNVQTSQISFTNINGIASEPSLVDPLPSNRNLMQFSFPMHMLVFNQTRENIDPNMLFQLLNDHIDNHSVTRIDTDRLPMLTMTTSNISIYQSCSICLEHFDVLSQVKQLPTCYHVFHTSCLTEWLLHHDNCPMCRTKIILSPSVSIFNNPLIQAFRTQQTGVSSNDQLALHPPVKMMNMLESSSSAVAPDSLSSDTVRLPRFDSQVRTNSSSNIE